MKQVSLRFLILLGVLLSLFAVQAFAQEATIVGTVTDPSGAAAPNVAITITNIDTGLVTKTTTNSVGQFTVPSLQVGHYTARAEAAGFKKAEQTGIVLAIGDRARLDFKLEIGAAQESVTVEAAPVAVQSETGEISDVITGSQVTQLSTNGRTIYSLTTLVAGASSNMADYQSATPVGGDANVSFNGLRMSHNIYLIDGGENLDRGGAGTISVMPSMDAIGEFRLLTSNYSADYGLSSAGTAVMVFKSGTKDFHGGAWWFLRREALDANTPVRIANNQDKPMNRLNTYGFNVGGPVFIPKVYNTNKDKSFFFYNMEWRKLVQGGALNTTVPLTSTYGGNLGSTAITVPTAAQLSPDLQAKFTGAGLTLGAAFPNNTIPTSLLSAQAQSLLKAGIFPAPTSGTKFSGGANAPTDVREEIIRADHHFTDKFWMFGHWVQEKIDQQYGTSMWSGDNVPTARNTFGNPSYSGVIHATYTISPTLLSETAFNYNGNRINILPLGIIGRPSDLNIPRLFPNSENKLNRIPAINLGGSTGTNYTLNWMPWTNKADDYQLREDFSWTKGSHQFKMGASWAIYKKIQTYFANTEGNFTFNGVYSGNDFADFLLGLASGYTEDGYQGMGHWDNTSWAAYFQDNWKVNNRLTLNLGLRWDGIPHTYDENSYSANFYPNLYDKSKLPILLNANQISPNSPGLGTSPLAAMQGFKFYLNGIGLAGQNGIPKGLVNDVWNAFGPRVGFAYDLTGTGKTILRGGVGIMYERIQGNDMYNGATNAPYGANVGFQNVLLANPNISVLTGQTLVAPITINNITGLYQSDYKAPFSMQYSFGVQHEVYRNSVLSVSYVGNQNRHQNSYTDINNPAPNQLPGIINGTTQRNMVVPYLGWGAIRLSGNNMNSHYNGLQADFHTQASRDLSLQIAYTFSKAMDPVNQGGGIGDMNNVSNPYDRSYDDGPSPLDRRHIFIANFVYDLPILRGNSGTRLMRATLGGWQVSGIILAETGFPLNITQGGTLGSNGLANGTNRPDVKGSVSFPHTWGQWFNATPASGCKGAFCAPAIGSWGNSAHHAYYGPGRHNWNLSLFKSFTISESDLHPAKLELRFETFNAFNHTQFQNVSSTYDSSDFGQVTSTYNPRNIQLAMKFVF